MKGSPEIKVDWLWWIMMTKVGWNGCPLEKYHSQCKQILVVHVSDNFPTFLENNFGCDLGQLSELRYSLMPQITSEDFIFQHYWTEFFQAHVYSTNNKMQDGCPTLAVIMDHFSSSDAAQTWWLGFQGVHFHFWDNWLTPPFQSQEMHLGISPLLFRCSQ